RDAALHRRVWRLVGTARVGRGIEHRVYVCVGRSGHVLDRPGWHRVGGGVMSVDLELMTDQELADLIEGASELLAKRRSRAAVDREVAEVLRNARAEGVTDGPEPGEEWVQPVGAHDAYLAGDVVSHGGKL